MIERHLHTVEDVRLLIQWMQAPPGKKPIVPFDANSYLERLRLADRWLRTHLSKSKVWPMLLVHFKELGVEYSESTARRDCDEAQRLFETLDSNQQRWWVGMMLDVLGESLVSAKNAHKYSEVTRITREIREYLIMGERLGLKAPEDLDKPVPRRILQDPSEAGVDHNPNIREEARQLIEHIKQSELHKIPEAQLVPSNAKPND